jgi:hypothetical protein
LVALSEVGYADPANTRFDGDVRNPLAGDPGAFYGVELDLGVRYRRFFSGTLLEAGLEGAVFFPSSAFVDSADVSMDPVLGMRGLLRYSM